MPRGLRRAIRSLQSGAKLFSREEESFSDGLLEHPQYTKPAEWQGLPIPDVLQSGHHGEIAKWRQTQAEEITKTRRPDLWQAYLRRKS